jgi:putative membrane protein
MTALLGLLWGTLRLRPSVFAFLVVHCWTAGRALWTRRAAALTGMVWVTAFAAGWLSMRVGFPFGHYVYTESTRGQELFLSNVPFMDSPSFPFLAWVASATALTLLLRGGVGTFRSATLRTAPASWRWPWRASSRST